MNPDTPQPPNKTRIKRWLPYFILAAIVINTSLVMIPIDVVSILITSLAKLFGAESGITPQTAESLVTATARTYANIMLIALFLIVALRARDK